MPIQREKLLAALVECLKGAGTRRFVQSVELIVGFRGIDFSKPENRISADVVLPHPGTPKKVLVFADGPVAHEAKKHADRVVGSAEIAKISKSEVKSLAREWEFLAEPRLMVVIGKTLGAILGARGLLPRPLVGDVGAAVRAARSLVRIRQRGKYMPTVGCTIGSEKMSPEQLANNAAAVISAIEGKMKGGTIAAVHVKLSMGRAIKV